MTKPDRIVLSGMEFHAFHGAHPEEAVLGARFSVDVELGLHVRGRDRLDETVDYSKVYDLVAERVTGTRYQLIEALASDIADRLLADFSTVSVLTVRVHKPGAPLPGIVRDVYVEINRSR